MLSTTGTSTKFEESGVLREDPGIRFDLVALNMLQSKCKKQVSAPPSVADAPDNRITELFPDTAITHAVPGHGAKHPLSATETQLSLRAADKAYQRKVAKYGSICVESGLKYLLTTYT